MFADLGKPPSYLLSRTEIPPNPNSDGSLVGEHFWHSLDNEKNFRKNPHPTFGPTDIVYRFNRHGYRAPELNLAGQTPDTVNFACIGSSGLFGTGLPDELTLPHLLQNRLSSHLGRPVQAWNFGVGGTGPGYVTRMLFSVLPVIKPDFVLLTTHPFNRREYLGETGTIYTTQSRPHWQHRFIDPERFRMHQVCAAISNPYNHAINFITHAKVWESLCDDAGAAWLFLTEGLAGQIESINPFMRDARKMVSPGMFDLIRTHRSNPETGLARDMLHSGVAPTREHADTLFDRYLELYPNLLNDLKARSEAVDRDE